MSLHNLYFSPTGGTRKVARILCAALGGEAQETDLSRKDANFGEIPFGKDDTVLLAVPSYSGRVPAPAIERIASLQGNGAKAILICVYGNRAYEDTLVELQDTARQAGFQVVAAVAAIAEHSIAHRYAADRPDAQDQTCLEGFGAKIHEKLEKGDMSEPAIPGNRPYRKAGKTGMVPKPTRECVKCGFCAQNCPTGAIDLADSGKVDSNLCISCMRCVAICPHHARKVNGLMLALVDKMLKKACADRKEPEIFL